MSLPIQESSLLNNANNDWILPSTPFEFMKSMIENPPEIYGLPSQVRNELRADSDKIHFFISASAA